MANLVIKGGHVVGPHTDRLTNIWVTGNKIAAVGDDFESAEGNWQVIDASGSFVTPGLFDIQVNGDGDCDLWADPLPNQIAQLKSNLLRHGVTSFLPTLITDDIDHLKKNMAFLASQGLGLKAINGTVNTSAMVGIHLEGPFLSPEKPGVHPPQHLQPLSSEAVADLVNDKVALITLAPELEPDSKAVDYLVKRGTVVSLGHSNATFAEAQKAFGRGVKMMTHTFNALPALKHRGPGAVGAALLDDSVSCCVIADGLHVDPPMVKMLVRSKGFDKVILVSDAAHIGTTAGDLVGSSITLDDAVRNVVKWQVADFAQAIKMASFNPAQALCLEHVIGQLEVDCLADIVIWDRQHLTVRHVIKNGQMAF